MEGYLFIQKLQKSLTPNQLLGNNFRFVKWMQNGGLQIQINADQRKAIPAEILMVAYRIKIRNNRIRTPIIINQKWLIANGFSDWCFIEVIEYLLNNYDHKF
jgi:hypothetical protein